MNPILLPQEETKTIKYPNRERNLYLSLQLE